jgi:hypothetical protein
MYTSELTDTQKDLLRLIIKSDDEGQLPEKGILRLVSGDDKFMLLGCGKELSSLSDLDELYEAGLLNKEQGRPNPIYRITNAARKAIADDFKMPDTQPASLVTIGAFIGTMSGGNVQAVGSAQGSELKQIINDPDLLRQRFEMEADRLLTEVKSELDAENYNRYLRAVEELKQQVLAKKQDPSLIKQLLQRIALLSDVEGTIGLINRVWPLIQPLLAIVAMKLEHGI